MTWSIIARDKVTGSFGIAVATRFFAVGARVPFIAAKVGAVATQALVNPFYGADGLALLRQGKSAPEAVAALKRDGIDLAILSGDRAPAVARIADVLGIVRWRAALSPRGKTEAVAERAAMGHRVLMVGDGINDAPALAAAHVSMAPATAADVGRQAADFVFLHESLEAVPFAHETARRAS